MYHEKASTTQSTEAVHIRHLRTFIAKNNYDCLTVQSIPANFFKNYYMQRSKEVKKCTVRKELRTFKYILNDIENKPKNLFKGLKMYKKDKAPKYHNHQQVLMLIESGHCTEEQIKILKRYRYFNIDELNNIIALAQGKEIFPILMMVICTGMRRGELINLKWSDINFEEEIITVYSKKQSRQCDETSRIVGMDKRLINVLLEHKKLQKSNRFVFVRSNGKPWNSQNVGSLNKKLQKALAGTEFEGIGFHCFRHSIASNLVREGVDQRIINRFLGHTTDGIAGRYFHAAPIQIRSVLSNYLGKGNRDAK